MRCSAWSSLAISVCSALLFAAPAAAHVVVQPNFLARDGRATLSFSVPNERPSTPMTRFDVLFPAGFEVTDAHAVDGWRGQASGATATWLGGSLLPKQLTTFVVDVKARSDAGSVELEAEQRYPDHAVVRWPVALTVVPGEGESQHVGLALVAGILGLLAITGFALFAVRRSRSKSR